MSLELLEEIQLLEKQKALLLKAIALRNEIALLKFGSTIGPNAFRAACATIAGVVCEHYRVSLDKIVSDTRLASIVEPRHIIFYLVRQFTSAPVKSISDAFSRKQHGTVLWAMRRLENRMEVEPCIALTVATLKEQCAEALKKGTNETQT